MAIILPIQVDEALRSRLCLTIGVVNWISIVCSLALVALGGYIRLSLDEFTRLVENYDGDTLPFLLVGLGAVATLVNAWGGFVFFSSADPTKREYYRRFLLLYVIVSLCVCLATAVGAIMCFTHIQHLHDSFKGGLSTAMQSYKEYPHLKMEVDKLQMGFVCCGNDDYTDWFHIDWVHHDYLNMKSESVRDMLENGAFTTDDVPFSCCSAEARRPCIHHHVHDNRKHYNYDYRQAVTLNLKGCREALMDFFGDVILVNGGYCVLGIFVFQLLLVLMARYVQTSVETSLQDGGDPMSPSRGYLCMCAGQEQETEAKAKMAEYSDDEQDDGGSDREQTDQPEKRSSRASLRSGSYRSLHTGSADNVKQGSSMYMDMRRYPSQPNVSPKRTSRGSVGGSATYVSMGQPGGYTIPPPPPLPASWD